VPIERPAPSRLAIPRRIPLGPERLRALTALVLAALVVLSGLAASAPASVDAASGTTYSLATRCSGVPLRTSGWTSAPVRRTLPANARVVADRTLVKGRWHTVCAGVSASGSTWWHITSINGRTVRSLYGVAALDAPTSLFRVVATATTMYPRCDGAAVRTSASTTARIRARIPLGTVVTSAGRVAGVAWSSTCGGSAKGTAWYRVSRIGGKSVTSLYGVPYVYAASGVLSTVQKLPAATSAPTPTPTPTPPPAGSPTATPAPIPTPNPDYLAGVDVSHWQGTIDWSKVAGSGVRFAFMKATEGICPTCTTYYTDPSYAANRAGANANGIVIGAYDFAQPSKAVGSAVADADAFLATAMPAMGDLAPVLDVETANGLTVADLTAWVQAWVAEVYARTGVRATIYVSPAFWAKYLGGTPWFGLNGYPVLWVAHWTTAAEPTVPGASWGGYGWTFWQYTNRGSVPGIGSARVDLDRFNGLDMSAFRIP
jgi:GH25 family lysozyme M1 (1,4-beta-N-acetylmuramidase)